MVNWAAPSAVNPGLLDDTLLMTPTSGLPWSISSHAFLATATATVGSWYVMPALLSAAKKLASGPELAGSACAGVATPSTASKPVSMTRNRTASSSYRLAPLSGAISTRMTITDPVPITRPADGPDRRRRADWMPRERHVSGAVASRERRLSGLATRMVTRFNVSG